MKFPNQTPGSGGPGDLSPQDYRRQIEALEARLEESEQTLEAIARGDFDAVVTKDALIGHRVNTLQNADRPYRALIEQIREGAVTLGIDGTVFYCNRRLPEMLGVTQERVIGRTFQPHIKPADLESFERLLESAYLGHARTELTLATAGGLEMPVYISLSLLENEIGQPLLCGVLSDLTEQKARLRELSDANARLVAASEEREVIEDVLRQSQKMEAVGQLTGGLAHDFNNLLAIIMGNLESMQNDPGVSRLPALLGYVKAATLSAQRAAAVTHRLLAFSRRQTLSPKRLLPNQLITGMETLLRQTVGSKTTVASVLEVNVGSIFCDPNQLENVLLNLAINARDAMPGGGKITITTANDHIDEAFANPRKMAPGDYVRVSVTDNGVGMSPKLIALAFDPFFTTKPLGQGTGLGLSMVYGFAKQSGGHARIHSVEALGTTVSIYLPSQSSVTTEPARIPSRSISAGPIGGETVLIVDDEADIRTLLVRKLKKLGYNVFEADDGQSGLRIIETASVVDILVTDVGLPGGMNGRQLADAARVLRPNLKVLFITGFADGIMTEGDLSSVNMELMTKPFAIGDLTYKLRAMIENEADRALDHP